MGDLYSWVKALHIMSVIAWMAGLFYLPRLFVYHAEKVGPSGETHDLFVTMETKLLRVIMTPAMVSSWIFGVWLASMPGVLNFGSVWVWLKLAAILAMTIFHMWCAARRREFSEGRNTRRGQTFRLMNEVPTVLMAVIVISVIVRPFS